MTNLIHIDSVNDVDVVDSRLIAIELGITHSRFYRTIKDNQSDIEQDFGTVCFESKGLNGTSSYSQYAYLNEEQATYLMTLSRNTQKVKALKRKLVKSFSQAKQVINQQNDRIRELELLAKIGENDRYLLETRKNIADIHGLAVLAQLEGRDYVEVEKPTIEVVDNVSGQTNKIMSAKDLIAYVYKLTGQKIKSKKQLVDYLRSIGRDDLLIAVRRQTMAQDINADKIEEAIALFSQGNKQMLLGE